MGVKGGQRGQDNLVGEEKFRELRCLGVGGIFFLYIKISSS